MTVYWVHTEETVHGIYEIEADTAEEAEKKLMDGRTTVGEQKLYEAITMEIEKVEEVQS